TQGLGIPCSIRTELQAHYSFKNITENTPYFNFPYEIATSFHSPQ
ncbi:unnamed protein product, partial [marine sediment metagenome]